MDLKTIVKFGFYVIVNLILINYNLQGQGVKGKSDLSGVNNDDFMKFKDNIDIINTLRFKIFNGDRGLIRKSQSKDGQDWEYRFVQGNYLITGKKTISFKEVKSQEGEFLRIDTTFYIDGRVDWLYPRNNKEFENLRTLTKCIFTWEDSPIKSEVELIYRFDNSQMVYSTHTGLPKNECNFFEGKYKGNVDDLKEFRVQNIFLGNGFDGTFNIKGDTLNYILFKDGLRTGKFESRRYNENVKKYFVQSSGNYSFGKKNGIFLTYDDYGFINEEIKYNMGIRVYEKMFHPVFHQEWKNFKDHEFPPSIRLIRNFDSKDKEHGIQKYFHYPKIDENGDRLSEIGVLEKIETFDHSYFNGEYVQYFENGKVYIRGLYLTDLNKKIYNQKVGVWEEFDFEGNLVNKEEFMIRSSNSKK